MNRSYQRYRFLFILMTLPVSVPCFMQFAMGENSMPPGITEDIRRSDDKRLTHFLLPYVFYTESFEFTVGLAGGATGFQKGQAGIYATAFATTNSTSAVYVLGSDIQVPLGERLFVDPIISVGWFAMARDYVSGNPDFPDEEAGSNDSSPDNFVTSSGWDTWAEFRFKYILPMGHARGSAINTYTLKGGILVSGAIGGDIWNPLESGVTFFQIKPFYRYRTFDFDTGALAGSTNGVELSVVHDNRDFSQNPSKGSTQKITLAQDYGCFNSAGSWSVLKGKFSKYLSLGSAGNFRQRVVALNLWASDNVSRTETITSKGTVISHRAPLYMGSSLGGFYRLRAYPSYRFNDKVAIYYGAEIRLIPDWNPLGRVSLLDFFDIDWMQLVGLVEAGRVADQWSGEVFYNDLHWDAGIGIRFMARKVVVRLDTAFSNEGWSVVAMAGQAF